MNPTVLVSSWSEGLMVVGDGAPRRELEGRSVRGLADDGQGGALAIVDAHLLQRRSPTGSWQLLAQSDAPLSCCLVHDGGILVGTDDARVLRLEGDRLEPLPGFDAAPDRERWYAGSVVVDGAVLGPPLGVRSMHATADGALLVNVHVGGIPRSTDGGRSWRPTIDVDADVHEVRAHDSRPELAVAATAIGLGVSHDGGATWSLETEGLHASYCSAVAICGEFVIVAASDDHFSPRGAIYHRPLDGSTPLTRMGGGFPEWTEGIADTGCIAARGEHLAIASKSGGLHLSSDQGHTWHAAAGSIPAPSSALIC